MDLKKLNEDQNAAFERIKDALQNPGLSRCFFVEGAGGCGKTFFYNTLIKWILAGKSSVQKQAQSSVQKQADDSIQKQAQSSVQPQAGGSDDDNPDIDQTSYNIPQPLACAKVISAASTGNAATLLIGASTVHRQFFVPNDVNKDTQPRINHESPTAQRFRDAEIIVIDEVSMLDEKVLNYVDRLLREICTSDQPFGGKVIVLGGDWKQLTPVVPNGGQPEQVNASIKMDPLFKNNFETLRLTINMRTDPDQVQLREWLHEIGNGKIDLLTIPAELQTKNIDEMIEFCFPPELFLNPLSHADKICDAALLCPRNEDVHRINDKAIDRMAGTMHTCLSIDTPLHRDPTGANQFDAFRSDYNIEAIHKETPTGLPPHELKLKIGAPVMLIRNLDVSQGLCNGTRLQVEKIGTNIRCKILTGPRKGKTVLIPMIKIDHGTEPNHRGLRFTRIQFPLRLCFAMTVNKSQGQTLKRMGLVLNGHQCFSHGQVYVAFSRVTTMNGIRVFSPMKDSKMKINNIVYKELLDGIPVKPKNVMQTREFEISDYDSDSSNYSDYYNSD